MNPKVSSVKVPEDYLLELGFDNGEKEIFSMKPYLDYPVFKPLQDYQIFMQAKVIRGFIFSWNDDIDLSHDTLYLESKIPAV